MNRIFMLMMLCLTVGLSGMGDAYAGFGGVLARSAEKKIAVAGVAARTRHGDRLVKRWNQHFCDPKPCPLDNKTASTFTGHSYDEVALEKDTILYRAYHAPSVPSEGQWWKRSPNAKGTSAIIGNAIPPSSGNYADEMVKIRVPKGQVIYEGKSARQGGLVGGDGQVFLERIETSWVVR